MDPSAVIPNYELTFPLKDDSRTVRRPSNLTVSSGSCKVASPEPSPTRSRCREGSRDGWSPGTVQEPFIYVGPDRTRFHVQREEAPYPMPCRLEELSRMNLMHYVLYNIFHKRHYLTEFKVGELPRRVLDIGCGTGIWFHDVAKQWAEAGHTDVEFVGIDLVPIQSPLRDINVKYHYLNILTDDIPYEDGYFDYVHIRGLAAGIPENCWVGDHKTASGVLDKAIRVLRVGGYFEVVEVNLLFSYFDVSANPPRQLPPDFVFSKDDTVAPFLSKVFTNRHHTLSPSVHLGINPFPLSILPAQLTFLPLTQLHTIRHFIPVARFNVPMVRPENEPMPKSTQNGESGDLAESVATVAGYVSAGETYSSLKPELVRVIREENRGDAYNEYRRIERRSAQKWLSMEIPDMERRGSVVSTESVRKVRSGESAKPKSIESEQSRSSSSLDCHTQISERDVGLEKVQLKKEVGAWWGKKTGD